MLWWWNVIDPDGALQIWPAVDEVLTASLAHLLTPASQVTAQIILFNSRLPKCGFALGSARLDHWPQGKSFLRSPCWWFQDYALWHLKIMLWSQCLPPAFLTNEKPKSKRNHTAYSKKVWAFSHFLEPGLIQFTDTLNGPFLLHRHFG